VPAFLACSHCADIAAQVNTIVRSVHQCTIGAWPSDRPCARFNLGEPWDSDLADFLVAHFGASATDVVRIALRAFIDDQLAKDPESKKRFDEARRKRLGLNGDKIRLLPTSK
jgi:hypothetical protein